MLSQIPVQSGVPVRTLHLPSSTRHLHRQRVRSGHSRSSSARCVIKDAPLWKAADPAKPPGHRRRMLTFLNKGAENYGRFLSLRRHLGALELLLRPKLDPAVQEVNAGIDGQLKAVERVLALDHLSGLPRRRIRRQLRLLLPGGSSISIPSSRNPMGHFQGHEQRGVRSRG